MFRASRYGIIVIAVLVLIVLVIVWRAGGADRFAGEMLEGTWNGDRMFCQEAGLDSTCLFVGPLEDSARACYLTMVRKDGGVICAQPLAIRHSKLRNRHGYYELDCRLEADEDDGDIPLPENVTIELCPKAKTLRMRRDDEVLGFWRPLV